MLICWEVITRGGGRVINRLFIKLRYDLLIRDLSNLKQRKVDLLVRTTYGISSYLSVDPDWLIWVTVALYILCIYCWETQTVSQTTVIRFSSVIAGFQKSQHRRISSLTPLSRNIFVRHFYFKVYIASFHSYLLFELYIHYIFPDSAPRTITLTAGLSSDEYIYSNCLFTLCQSFI